MQPHSGRVRGRSMHQPLDPSSALPLYKQLVHVIKDDIVSGRLKPNQRISSEAELSQDYGISRITVRTAISELVEEGMLVKRQGKGTFVASNNARDVHQFINFTQSAQMQGMQPSTKVLEAKMMDATPEDVGALELQPGSQIVFICRVRYADGRPVSYERTYFAPEYRYLLDHDLTGSLYDLLKETRSIVPMHSYSSVELCNANETEAKYLQVHPGDALMLMIDLVYDQQKKPIHRSKQIMGPGFKFHV